MDYPEGYTTVREDAKLARAYSEYESGEYRSAFDSFTALSDGGCAEASYCLGFMYLNGQGVVKDAKKAFSCFVKSADAGFITARTEVAQCYAYGIGTRTDDGKAFDIFLSCAEDGDPYAMSMVSLMYHNGDGVRKNHKEAEKWTDMCFELGENDDSEDTGLTLIESGNAILGRMYLMRSAAMGSPVAAMALSMMFEYGVGVSPDEDEASDWKDTAEDYGWDDVTIADLGDHEEWFAQFINTSDLPEE